MQLGIVGLGRMGGNIVRRLMRRGHEWVPISSRRPCGMGLAVTSNRR
ncbi:MAG TPA: NAD(P)-binding domain-containing protein [Roseiarcus sp.]|nr:NAD(P)-binding domain-containing protein [Roseiarcus sp.]